MKDAPSSRGSAATKSANHSNASSNEPIGTDSENLNGSNASGAIGTIDPNDNSYFIQYHPEVAEKLSNHNSTYSVSGRCLSIVASRMLYWSRYAKHRFQGKLWYWKNQTELSEETGFSVKQINRALKVLVELGVVIREKFQKHYYRQVYFYHIPSSPHTKELRQPDRTTSTIHQSKGFRSMGTKCPNQSKELQPSIKQTLLNIVEKCKSYGNKEIYKERFGLVA
jgi:DNA-binding Lrp family transcriptional regulator